MRPARSLSFLLVGLLAVPAHAQPPHLASPAAVNNGLAETRAQRGRDLAALIDFLHSDRARAALADRRVEPDLVSARLGALSDQELHELAARKHRLDMDPAAGEPAARVLLDMILFMVGLLLVYLVLAIVMVASCSDGCFD